MSSYFPIMKTRQMQDDQEDEMYSVHGHAINRCRETIIDSLRKIIRSRSVHDVPPVCIADFGTADGRSSLSLINEIIDIVQADLGKQQVVVVYYNDQPRNDFNLLSKVIQENKMMSERIHNSNVYPVIVPKSMYEQCLPGSTLDIGFEIKNGVFMGEADESEQHLMKARGKSDWRDFVISRGRELKPGGFLITLNASVDEEDNVTSHIDKGNHHLGSFVSDMARQGVITQAEYLAMNFPNHYLRNAEDFMEPFHSGMPEVVELGLELVSMKTLKQHLPYPVFDVENKNEAERLEYSRRIVDAVYPWFYHVLYRGLSVSRTEDEKQKIIDQYFQRLQTYAFEHSDHKPYLIFTEVVIGKRIK